MLMSKRWGVLTNDLGFEEAVGRKCPGGHPHCLTQGQETSRTAFYTKEMAVAIAGHWQHST